MINGILGKKLGMTRVFEENGAVTPVTVVEAGPCTITQIKTTDYKEMWLKKLVHKLSLETNQFLALC